MFRFDSYNTFYKSPMGAARCESAVTFRTEVKKDINAKGVNFVLRGECETKFLLKKSGTRGNYDVFEGEIIIENAGLYFYRFEVIDAKGALRFTGTNNGHTAVCGDWLPEWRLAAYEKDFKAPCGFEGAVMYQIFPDRFFKADGVDISGAKNSRIIHEKWNGRPQCFFDYDGFKCNDYFLGNLRGIEQKLSYIKDLGVTHIYLNPIFESSENHRYSTSDYLKIDPYLGSEEDFISLCKAAKELDIKIILDGVFSHTGDDSRYFNKYGNYDSVGAYNSPASPFYNWYNFYNYPNEYECWWGFKTLPNVKETTPEYTDFITGKQGVLRYWMRRGASGWRLDVADELPDPFLEKIRTAVKSENENAVIIGEVWENAVTKRSYGAQRRFLLGKQCDTVMNYPFLNGITDFIISGNSRQFYETVMSIISDYPAPSVKCLMNMLSTHDTTRILNRLATTSVPERRVQSKTKLTENERKLGISRLMAAAIIQYTLPGVPCVFYGDEAGVEGFGDPACRATYPWGQQDSKLLELHKSLGKMRNDYKMDFDAPIEFEIFDGGVLKYRRGNLIITVNRTDADIKLDNSPIITGFSVKDGILSSGGAVVQRR